MIFSLVFLDTIFALQAHFFLKAIVLGITYTDKSNVLYNYSNKIYGNQ